MKPLEHYKGLGYLALLLVVVPLSVWRLAISDTARAWFSVRRLSAQVERLRAQESPPAEPELTPNEGLIAGGDLLHRILGADGIGDCSVVRFTPYRTGNMEGLNAYIDEVVLSGPFNSLVRVVDHIERNLQPCRLISVSMRVQKSRNREEPQLQATLVIQQIQ